MCAMDSSEMYFPSDCFFFFVVVAVVAAVVAATGSVFACVCCECVNAVPSSVFALVFVSTDDPLGFVRRRASDAMIDPLGGDGASIVVVPCTAGTWVLLE